ncbi:MAG: bestrophin family ion channel [Myxococcota bacterium]
MLFSRRFPLHLVFFFALRTAGVGALWALVVFCVYEFVPGTGFLRLPFLPIATIGTAVAFYVGFKNNSAYERFWEGRKIWGGIVNSSRTWAAFVMSYVRPGDESPEAHEERRVLVYRHLAWVNALRLQLRKTSRFYDRPVRTTRIRLENHAEHMRNDWDKEILPFLSESEHALHKARANPATHMLNAQGTHLARLHRAGEIDLFRQLALMEVVEELYTLQGKCERIKNTPFPRQYAEYSRWFTRVFVALVPFGLLSVFGDQIDHGSVLQNILPVIPMLFSSALITWVFTTMEGIGDSSEDPFERSMNDVPMNALSRTIEIDLRELLGEKELPEKEQPIDHVMY